MKRIAFALLAATLLSIVSCSAAHPSLLEPDFVVRQVGGMPFAARHVTGPISVNLQVDVINRSEEDLIVEHIRFETIGDVGAYTIDAQTRPFNRTVRPRHVETLELQLPAFAQASILGNNGPVTIRGVAYLKSDYGKFQKIFLQPLNDGMRGQKRAE